MASPPVDISHGITINFTGSAFVAEITDVTPPGEQLEDVNVSHQGSVDYEEYLPAPLRDNTDMEFTVHFNPDTDPPMGVSQTIMITFPSGSNWTFTGYMKGYQPQAPHKDKMVATVTVKASGEISRTAGS